ncbi:MAG: hypothetical protein LBT40_16545, partial [Deltaproteobacteria bacterium]|nr:hypothetical protein [Deltaproteobacteria bacterium]
ILSLTLVPLQTLSVPPSALPLLSHHGSIKTTMVSPDTCPPPQSVSPGSAARILLLSTGTLRSHHPVPSSTFCFLVNIGPGLPNPAIQLSGPAWPSASDRRLRPDSGTAPGIPKPTLATTPA